MNTKFDWREGFRSAVSAQLASEVFERLEKTKEGLTPHAVVEDSRPDNAPMHKCFEWDDEIAGEKYREYQAANYIRCICVKTETIVPDAPEMVKLYYHIPSQQSYKAINLIMSDKDMKDELLAIARQEMVTFTNKYRNLTQLQDVLNAMDKTIVQISKSFVDEIEEAI